MRQALRSSTVHLRAIVAAVLALGLVPAIATLAWAAPSLSIDSGPSGPTNDTLPLFGFTVDAGATAVECSIDDGTTPAYDACSGVATHEPDEPLEDGEYVFRVRATDAALEETVVTRSFSVDTADPSGSIISGPSGPTNNAAPSFGFTAEAGATIECSVDDGAASYEPCTSGTTHVVGAPLAEGTHFFRLRVTDAAGNDTVFTRSFSVDTTPPTLTIDSGPAGAMNDATPSFGFTPGAGATVECSIDQGAPAWGSCTGASEHVVGSPLADGSYTFRVRATDAAGNQTVEERSFSVDTTPPSLTIDSGPAGPTNDATPSFGFSTDGVTVVCSIDQGTPAYGPCTGGRAHDALAPLSDGDYFFRVRSTDGLGNPATVTQPFSVDSSAPSLTIDSGPAGPTNDAAPSFGFSTDGVTVACSVDQGTPAWASCTSGTTHAVGAPLPDGTHTFRVRATNGLGTHAISARTFTVDTTPPPLSIGFGPSGTTSDSTPLFGFSVEAGATAECSIDQGAPAYGSCASPTTHAAVAPLADGAYLFRVRATDAVGNQASVTRAFTVDTVPQVPGPESPRPDPTPPAASPEPPTPPEPRLLSPFPLVRISGTLTATGARIRLLSVRASRGTLVRVTVSLACTRERRSARQCRVLEASGTVGRSAVIRFRQLARAYGSGTVIVVRAWRADRIGKYTRFTIVRGKAPRRVDQCLVPEATRGSRCPSV
jgi:Bacterial Ig-like domain